ncbi:MAG: RluA family pseudouridine synthase [Ignavibacteriales bacterium]|nr:RluA family pseudouridine synthase [Ignavibacteriales bacterium]
MSNIITEKKYKFVIQPGKTKERLDTYLTKSLEQATRSRVQKLIKAECVSVNGKIAKSNYLINPNDIIEINIPVSPRPEKNEPENIPLDIIYEDEELLVINKPAGMVVHPSCGNYTGTLVNALLYHVNKLSHLRDESKAGIVHRLDKDTSGLLLIAKDEWTHNQLAKQFSAHTIEREYWALCWGLFKGKSGEVIGNIARSIKDRKIFTVSKDSGKHAHTFYEVLEEYDFLSLVKLNLKTGRTHQIRVHMSYINHPIFGDPTYGGRTIRVGTNITKIKQTTENLLKIINRQALHAKTLGFVHPKSKKFLRFDSELPKDIKTLIERVKSFSENQ